MVTVKWDGSIRHWIAPTIVCNPSHFLLISISVPAALRALFSQIGGCDPNTWEHTISVIKGISQRVQLRKESTSTYIITPDADSSVGL